MRVLVRCLAALLGLAIAVTGLALAGETAWAWLRPGAGPLVVPWRAWRARLAVLPWASPDVRLVAVVVAVLGLLLVLAALAARRRQIRLFDPAPEVSVTTSPRSLARLVRDQVRAADGVDRASVRASSRKVRIHAASHLESEKELRSRVRDAARHAVADLPLPRSPRVDVVVDSARRPR